MRVSRLLGGALVTRDPSGRVRQVGEGHPSPIFFAAVVLPSRLGFAEHLRMGEVGGWCVMGGLVGPSRLAPLAPQDEGGGRLRLTPRNAKRLRQAGTASALGCDMPGYGASAPPSLILRCERSEPRRTQHRSCHANGFSLANAGARGSPRRRRSCRRSCCAAARCARRRSPAPVARPCGGRRSRLALRADARRTCRSSRR